MRTRRACRQGSWIFPDGRLGPAGSAHDCLPGAAVRRATNRNSSAVRLQDRLVLDNRSCNGNADAEHAVPVPPSLAATNARGSRGSSVRFAVGSGGNHAGYLTPAELRLLSEWVDIGAQYFNNPIGSCGSAQLGRCFSAAVADAGDAVRRCEPLLRTSCRQAAAAVRRRALPRAARGTRPRLCGHAGGAARRCRRRAVPAHRLVPRAHGARHRRLGAPARTCSRPPGRRRHGVQLRPRQSRRLHLASLGNGRAGRRLWWRHADLRLCCRVRSTSSWPSNSPARSFWAMPRTATPRTWASRMCSARTGGCRHC